MIPSLSRLDAMRLFLATIAIAFSLSACALQRSQEAEDAKTVLVGMTKKQIFSCMGLPKRKGKQEDLEIWSYNSDNGYVDKFKKSASGATGFGAALGVGDEVDERRFCTVQLLFGDGVVKAVNYNGPTGGFLTDDEQCAYAVRNCLPK